MVRGVKKGNMTSITPNAPLEGTAADLEDADDLFEVKDMLESKPKSRSPQIGGRPENIKTIMNDQQNLLQLDGEFSIVKGYGNDQRAKLFSVGNPHRPKNADHFMFTVFVSGRLGVMHW